MSCLVRAFSFSQLQSSSCCQPTSGGPRCSSTAEQRAEPFPPSLSQPPLVHLTFCLEGWDCVRRSPLSLSFFSFLALMELYLRQRGNIFHLFLFSPPATAPRLTISFFFFPLLLYNTNPLFLFCCLYLLSFSSAVYCNVAFRCMRACVCLKS